MKRIAIPAFLIVLVFAGLRAAGQEIPAEKADISAQIEKARTIIRDKGAWDDALYLLSPLWARIVKLSDTASRIDLAAELFLLQGIAESGRGDERSAIRDFRGLYDLGADVARQATKNLFDPKILALLKKADRESQGLPAEESPPAPEKPAEKRDAAPPAEAKDVKPPQEPRPAGPVYESIAKLGDAAGVALSAPVGIALTGNGRVAVIDASEARIKILDGRGKLLSAGDPVALAAMGLTSPAGIATDREGNFFITDAASHLLFKLDAAGKPLGKLGGLGAEAGKFNTPGGLAGDGADAFYIADTGNNRIVKIDIQGRIRKTWGGPETFQTPHAVAVGREGLVYVLDDNRIQSFTPDGAPATAWSGEAAGTTPVAGAMGLAAGPDGSIFVADTLRGRVLKFDPSGRLLAVWGGEGPDALKGPWALAVDAGGAVFVVERDGNRIQVFLVRATAGR
jgi:sugar lactone lactonase YvrE